MPRDLKHAGMFAAWAFFTTLGGMLGLIVARSVLPAPDNGDDGWLDAGIAVGLFLGAFAGTGVMVWLAGRLSARRKTAALTREKARAEESRSLDVH